MVEIKCNKQQKKIIIASLLNPDGCLFPRKRNTCVYDPNASCEKCFETKIKWTHSNKLSWQKKPRYEGDEHPYLVCPKCNNQVSWWDKSNFCPNCGEDMRGKENG